MNRYLYFSLVTTPWTLIGNVALAIGENIEYVKFQINNSSNLDEFILLLKIILRNFKIFFGK
jgi:isoleucyl-tRNA synthetase